MENRMKFEGQIECISILRVVGALGIALYHIGTFNDHIATLQAGVSLFFVLAPSYDVYNSEGGIQSLYLEEIDSDCSSLLDYDGVYFCSNAGGSVDFNGGGVRLSSSNRYSSYRMFATP